MPFLSSLFKSLLYGSLSALSLILTTPPSLLPSQQFLFLIPSESQQVSTKTAA